MIRRCFFVVLVASSLAPAQQLEKAPVLKPNHALACPTGTKQVGGARTNVGALACMKFAGNGLRLFHGPMITFYATGRVEAVGQMEEGFRTGKWAFFDQAGNRLGETEFLRGDYHGRRVEFTADGKLKFEENWVSGKRQGPQKTFDAAGVPTVTEYRDDRPVAK